MTDRTWPDDPDPLALQALLYAAGELDGLAAAAFEAQLGTDPAAQDALAQAVTLTALLAGEPTRPDPAYRSVVRDRLTARRGWWGRLTGRRIYPGHPAAWGLLGACAAACLLLFLRPAEPPAPAEPAALPAAGVAAVPPAEEPPAVADARADDDADEAAAEVWADLSNMDHLRQAHDEHLRRRTRASARPLSEANRARPLHSARPPRR